MASDPDTSWESPGVLAAVALIAAVLAGGVWIVFFGGTNSAPTEAPTATVNEAAASTPAPANNPAEAAEPAEPGDPSTSRQGDCPDTQPTSDTIPTSAPAVRWESYRQQLLPYSERFGPATVEAESGIARCFSRTPEGALIAASHLGFRVNLSPSQEVLLGMTVKNEGQTALAEFFTERGYFQLDAPIVAGTFCQLAGFSWLSFTNDSALLQMASRCPDGGLQLVTITLRWVAGDWLLVLEPDGGLAPFAAAIADLSGLISWGGI